MKRFVFISIILFIVNTSFAEDKFTYTSTTIAGFINMGDSSDDNINEVLTRSLILYLSRIPGVTITEYDDVEDYALTSGLWDMEEIDADLVTSMGYIYGAEQVVVGQYVVDSVLQTISGDFYIYDVYSGEAKIKRAFEGDSGIDLLDTVDDIVQKISLLVVGRVVKMGTLSVESLDPERTYQLYINNYYQEDITGTASFMGQVAANEEVVISIRLEQSGGEKEVYTETVFVGEDATYDIQFNPNEDIDQELLAEIEAEEEKEALIKQKPDDTKKAVETITNSEFASNQDAEDETNVIKEFIAEEKNEDFIEIEAEIETSENEKKLDVKDTDMTNTVDDTKTENILTDEINTNEDMKDQEEMYNDTNSIDENIDYASESDFEWKKSGGNITLTGYLGNGGIVNIPPNIDNKPVTSIGNTAFFKEELVSYVSIPNTVNTIGWGAFWNCVLLTNVIIPDSVTEIGAWAFKNCGFLNNVIIPDSVTSIGKRAFDNCDSLSSVTIPESVSIIEKRTFYDCDLLTNVIISDSVISIGKKAFEECDSLKNVVLPESLNTIESMAFRNCRLLSNINNLDSVDNIGSRVFQGCDLLKKEDISDKDESNSEIVKKDESNSDIDKTDESNSEIDNNIEVNIEKEEEEPKEEKIVVNINSYVDENIVYASESDFEWKESGGNITLTAYLGNDSVVNIPPIIDNKPVTKIGSSVFRDKDFISYVSIPKIVNTIGWGVFWNCDSLTNVFIPDSVTDIGAWAFKNCSSLNNVTIPDSVTSIGKKAFENCDSLTGITIPDSVISIGKKAFEDCDSLKNVVFTDSVSMIDNSAFRNCDSLQNVTISGSVNTIGKWVFFKCRELTNVNINGSLSYIGKGAFYYCKSLTSIKINAETPPILGWGILFSNSDQLEISVPAVSINKYKYAPIWNNYSGYFKEL